jgi:hypothetical protein
VSHRGLHRYSVEHARQFNQAGKKRIARSPEDRRVVRQVCQPVGSCHVTIVSARSLIPLEILNGAFVFLRCGLCLERAEISSFARLWIFLTGIQPVFAGFQLPDHAPLNIRKSRGLRAPIVGQPRKHSGLPNQHRQAERLLYKGLNERFETQRTSSAARIPRLVRR